MANHILFHRLIHAIVAFSGEFNRHLHVLQSENLSDPILFDTDKTIFHNLEDIHITIIYQLQIGFLG
jgi:hypothetical protein